MGGFEHSFDSDNFSLESVLQEFFDDSAYSKNTDSLIKVAAGKIPWDLPVYDLIEDIKDSTLRLKMRSSSRDLQLAMIEYHLHFLTKKEKIGSLYKELEKFVFLLSLIGDENASYLDFKSELDRMAFRVGELIALNRASVSDSAKLQILTQVIHEEERFIGNQIFYQNPDNSFLTKVLKTKLGIPITLSIIYILIGLRLELPLFGINMPLHFLVSYENDDFQTYVDPFNGGVWIDKDTCLRFLEANGYSTETDMFPVASTSSIIRRMYNNLILIYRNQNEKQLENILIRQASILQPV